MFGDIGWQSLFGKSSQKGLDRRRCCRIDRIFHSPPSHIVWQTIWDKAAPFAFSPSDIAKHLPRTKAVVDANVSTPHRDIVNSNNEAIEHKQTLGHNSNFYIEMRNTVVVQIVFVQSHVVKVEDGLRSITQQLKVNPRGSNRLPQMRPFNKVRPHGASFSPPEGSSR